MVRLYCLAILAILLFGFTCCSWCGAKKNGSESPAEEVGNVIARVTEYNLEGIPGPSQDAFYKMSIEFPTTLAIGEVIFRNSKSKFGGSRIEVKAPKSPITLIIRPATPANAGVVCVVATNADGRGFGGRFVTDRPVSEFTYDLPAGGAEFTAKVGEEVIIAAGRREEDGVTKEFFEVVLKTWAATHLLAEYANADKLGRETILKRVEKIGDMEAVPKLFNLTWTEPDMYLRTLIVETAGVIGKADSTDQAIEYFHKEKEIEPRGKVMHLLGRFRSKRGSDMLLKTIYSNTDTRVRIDATLSLGMYDPEQFYDILFKIMKDDKMPFEIRQNAAAALHRHHDADIKKLLADVKKYRAELKKDSKMEKTMANFEKYLNKVLSGEVERHHHEEEMDD